MSRLTWNAIGEHFYETGIDHGVLYVDDQDGVAWTGLLSVSEEPTGGEVTPYYLDGIKFLNVATAEEFEATLDAFYSPPEFAPCDGILSMQNGLYSTQQPRKTFGFSYRTKLGNDIDGSDYAYKIHLVYNALAAPSDRSNNTLGDSIDPSIFSWKITSSPQFSIGNRPTAHLDIDSRRTPFLAMLDIENILYGSSASAPRFPGIQELLNIVINADPQFTAIIDGGSPSSEASLIYDGGIPTSIHTTFLDGGIP